MQGTLVRWGPGAAQLAFLSHSQVSIVSTEQPPSVPPCLVLVHGMTDGLMFCSYVAPVVDALTADGWNVCQAQMTSSYSGYGCGSLDRDADELLQLCTWLRAHNYASRLVLMGQSTGCNDLVRFMQKVVAGGLLGESIGVAEPLHIAGTILQAPVSDTEMLNDEGKFPGLHMLVERAREMVSVGKAESVVMRFPSAWGGAPVCARRLLSLCEPQGDDDMFSFALTDTQLEALLSPVGHRPCLVLASGADEFVPTRLMTGYTQHAQRLGAAISKGGKTATVTMVEGAPHSGQGHESKIAAAVLLFCQQTSSKKPSGT